jgi:hypothetical protein
LQAHLNDGLGQNKVLGATGSFLVFGIIWAIGGTRRRALAIADHMTLALRQANDTLEARVAERTALLQDSNERLAAVNEQLRAVNRSFGALSAPGPVTQRLTAAAARLRTIVPAEIALAVAFRRDAVASPEPEVGLDADPSIPPSECRRWTGAAIESDRTGVAPSPIGGLLGHQLQVPLLDAQDHVRGYLMLGRDVGGFAASEAAVLSQFALLVASSLAVHETVARERVARAEAQRAQAARGEGCVAEGAHGARLARGNHEVVGGLRLKHGPHGRHVIARVAPVALRIQVPACGGDGGGGSVDAAA